jgi:hypothetical protein
VPGMGKPNLSYFLVGAGMRGGFQYRLVDQSILS